MLIDTHCHLDATEFDADRAYVAGQASKQGVAIIVVPAIERRNFDAVIALSRQHANCVYALGIHPLFVDRASEADLATLEQYVIDHSPMAIGEIGLDYFITKDNRERQVHFFSEQLKIAKRHDLPVLLHVRRSVDDVLKYVRPAICRRCA
jgi:TatD DNase family protein